MAAGGAIDGGGVVGASGGTLGLDCLLLRPSLLYPPPTPRNTTLTPDITLLASPIDIPGMTCGAPDSVGYMSTATQGPGLVLDVDGPVWPAAMLSIASTRRSHTIPSRLCLFCTIGPHSIPLDGLMVMRALQLTQSTSFPAFMHTPGRP